MRWMILVLALGLGGPVAADAPERRLTVTGLGEVAAAPDMATIRLGVMQEAKQAGAAMRSVGEIAGRMLTTLQEAGIEPRDMQTSSLQLSPVWTSDDRGGSRVTGFQAETQLTVRVRDLDTLGTAMDAVLEAGANLFRGLSFGLADPEPVADEARRRAVADAARKAALYAEAAGVGLGPILSLDESGGSRAPMPMMEAAMARGAPIPVAEGEVTTSARVTVVYEISAE